MKILPSERLREDVQALFQSLGQLPPPVEKPVFIALSGLPGTGKTYFSQKLTEVYPAVILESDALRKVLFPRPTYSWRESARLFRACYLLIEELLRRGIPLVLDATNLIERYRRKLYAIARKAGVKLILVKLQAPPEVVRKRLEAREKDPRNRSDAGWEVYLMMRPREEKIRRRHFVVDTTQDVQPAIKKILREIKK